MPLVASRRKYDKEALAGSPPKDAARTLTPTWIQLCPLHMCPVSSVHPVQPSLRRLARSWISALQVLFFSRKDGRREGGSNLI